MSARSVNENDGVFYAEDVVDGFVKALKAICTLHDTTCSNITDSLLLSAAWQLVDAFENELDELHVAAKERKQKEAK